MKYTKKPVTIDAWKTSDLLKLARYNWYQLPSKIVESYESGYLLFLDKQISIITLEGIMTAEYDDYVICGVRGELYPCKPDIFKETYSMIGSGF